MTNDDKAEIIEIINLYAFALDTHQWDLFDRVFTEDVVSITLTQHSYNPSGLSSATFKPFSSLLP